MSELVRYGIIGTGMMGHEHVRNLAMLEGAQITAYADPSSEQRWWTRQLLEERGLGEGVEEFSDPLELLRSAAVDAVVVASPNHTHRAVLEAVFDTHKHVLIEKPLCTTVEDARWVVERAAHHPGIVWTGMEYRYMAPVARLLEEVRGGTIGRLHMLAIREHRYPFLPKVDNWNRFARNTGGTFVEKCCHFFDLMRLITDDEAVRVFASAAQDVNHLDERYEGEQPDILDNGYVVVDFKSGKRALLDLCMFAEASSNEQEICATGDAGKVECFVPESRVTIGKRQPRSIQNETLKVDAAVLEAGAHHGSTYIEHQHFRQSVLAGTPPEVTAEDGLKAVIIGAAAEQSTKSGQPIEIKPD